MYCFGVANDGKRNDGLFRQLFCPLFTSTNKLHFFLPVSTTLILNDPQLTCRTEGFGLYHQVPFLTQISGLIIVSHLPQISSAFRIRPLTKVGMLSVLYSHAQSLNAGSTAATAVRFRHLATCCGTRGKRMAWQASRHVHIVGPSSLGQQQGMAICNMRSARRLDLYQMASNAERRG